jgi:hypothetical protein
VVVRKRIQGVTARLGQPLVAEAERGAPEPGHRLQVAAALIILDEDAVASLDHQRSDLWMGGEVGERVQMRGNIVGRVGGVAA